LLETRWPVFLWGAPGVGKSSVVRQIAESRGLPLIDIRASLLDPTDLRGIPTIEDGKALWCPPSFLPHDPDSKGVLFFDELNAAPTLVQASLYQLTLDRRVGEYVLPDGWQIIAAGNRAEDASVTFRMPAALANRFVHLDFETDFDDWRAWALANDLHHRVIAFLGTRRELLLNMESTDKAFPTPRSWEMLSDAVHTLGLTSDALDVLIGVVGEGAAMEFIGFCDSAITEERIQAKKAQKAAGILLNRFSPELAVLLARDMLRTNPAFSGNAGYLDFVARHQDLLM
jgi:MoxR-like ATPase